MLSARTGGLERSAADWHDGLQSRGHLVFSVGQPDTWFAREIFGEYFIPFRNPFPLDPTAAYRLKEKLWFCDVAIFHGNRAISFGSRIDAPFSKVALAHNFRAKRSIGKMDTAVAVSPAVRTFLNTSYPGLNTLEVPNLVHPPYSPFDPQAGPVVRVGIIGRLHANKGFETAIEACALLGQRGLSVELVIAGSGEEQANLERLAKKLGPRARFLGWVEDKREFFGAIDIFVLPSRTEPFGIVVLEAMSYGIPVIASAIDGPKDIITEGHDGLLVADRSAEGFAAAIAQLAASAPLLTSMRANGLRTIGDRYSFDVVSRRMSDALLAVRGRAAGPQVGTEA